MTIAGCPKCSEEVSLPSQASAQARVRCPHCQEEYVLSEVLDSLPPALEVLGDLGGSSQDSGHGNTSPGESALNGFGAAGDSPSQPATPAFDFHEQSAPSATRPSKPGAGARPRRRRKKPKNPVIEVLKIVGGGTVGIIGAQLIIWGVIGKDPFHLAPKVDRFADFLVPDDLVEGKNNAKDNNKVNKKPPKTISKNRSLPSNPKDNNTPKPSFSDALSPEIKDQTQKRNELTSNQSSTNNTDIGRTNLRDNSSKENSPPDKTSTDGNLNPKNEDFVGIRDAPVYTPKQLSNAVAKARNTMDAWKGADSENSATLGKEFYIALATVGHMVSCVDQGDSRFRDSLNTTHQLLGQLARSSLTVSRLAEQAGVWLKQADRANDGIVLAGRVASQIRQGKLVESRIELLSDPDTVIPLVTTRDPSSVFRPGSRILVISAIVDDPQENLGGYTGTASRVIYGGWVQVIRN